MNDAAAYVTGNFAPVETETTALDLKVRGQIPAEFEGRYVRNGPNPIGPIDLATHHWFLGDGMVHGVRLRDGKADWYRSRFVASERTRDLLGSGPPEIAAYTGPNTNVIGHGGKTIAIVEAGTKPVELSYELESIATETFGGTLLNGYTAHPKTDPATGELHAICYAPATLIDTIQYVVIDAAGSVTKTVPIKIPSMPMIHDMGLTASSALILDLPVAVDLDQALGGSRFPIRWFHDYHARVGVLPRSADSEAEVVWCDLDPCFAFHPLNSFDRADGRIQMDICVYETMFDQDRNGPFGDSMPILERWIVDRDAGRVSREVLDDQPQEFPRVADHVVGLEHRYGYTVSVGGGTSDRNWSLGDTIKHDAATGTRTAHDHGPGRAAAEPVFVPRDGMGAEDDGWLLTLVYDEGRDASDLVILDAADMAAEAVAVIELPARVPVGFHGNYIAD